MKQVIGMRAGVLLICGLLTQQVSGVAQEKGAITLGRSHYYSLIDQAVERHWAVPMSFYVSYANQGYDEQERLTSLAELAFGASAFRIQDIYLPSRLSVQGKLHINDRTDVAAATNPGNPRGGAQFGHFPNEQWLGLLAPAVISFGTFENREFVFNISAMYRHLFGANNCYEAIFGISVPVKHVQRSIDLLVDGGVLFRPGFSDATTLRNNSLQKFFGDYSGLETFVIEEVFKSKGLLFDARQSKTGVGDVSVFGLVDISGLSCHTDAFQIGVNLLFPSGGKYKNDRVGEIVLGNGGAYQAELFANLIFCSCLSAFNPTIRIATGFSSKYTGLVRIPKFKSHVHADSQDGAVSDHKNDFQVEQQLQNILDSVPPSFGGANGTFYSDSFDEYDSLVPAFADSAFNTRIKQGNRFLVSFGNYFYNIFNTNMRLGIFYDYFSKSEDKFCVKCFGSKEVDGATLNQLSLSERTSVRANSIGWNLAYKFENMLEIEIGSHHVFAGRNTERVHEGFITFVSVF